MTVRELIEALKCVPPSTLVYIDDWEGGALHEAVYVAVDKVVYLSV